MAERLIVATITPNDISTLRQSSGSRVSLCPNTRNWQARQRRYDLRRLARLRRPVDEAAPKDVQPAIADLVKICIK
ncbi:hypothetical protein [Mesorhizobium sp.]|uniref:hypothetical protein n=1 Tax=Mesorhizobium sp. TaxID=1871066 RepID=UPI00257B9FE8|nr:hypothetical protein [Mesorhizobium sp.]